MDHNFILVEVGCVVPASSDVLDAGSGLSLIGFEPIFRRREFFAVVTSPTNHHACRWRASRWCEQLGRKRNKVFPSCSEGVAKLLNRAFGSYCSGAL